MPIEQTPGLTTQASVGFIERQFICSRAKAIVDFEAGSLSFEAISTALADRQLLDVNGREWTPERIEQTLLSARRLGLVP